MKNYNAIDLERNGDLYNSWSHESMYEWIGNIRFEHYDLRFVYGGKLFKISKSSNFNVIIDISNASESQPLEPIYYNEFSGANEFAEYCKVLKRYLI